MSDQVTLEQVQAAAAAAEAKGDFGAAARLKAEWLRMSGGTFSDGSGVADLLKEVGK